MTKRNFLLLSLTACLLGSLATACAASAPPSVTATPLPSATPISSATSTPIISPAQTAISSPGETPAIPVITATGSFFALSVADINASARWYSEKLDMKIVMQPPKINQATVIVLEGQGLIVELIQQDNGVSLTQIAPTLTDRTLLHGIVKAGVIVGDFDQTVAILRQRNVTIAFGPFRATADQRANVIIQDNEGNLIQFFGK